MRSAIDAAGRIVIPKPLRERLGLTGGQAVDIVEREGRLEIEPALTPMKMVRRRSGLVAVPDKPVPPLTDRIVRDVLEAVRR